MSRIGIFGGTFDPVHNGHLAIALAALESAPLDRVVFVPARRSPGKDREPAASTADRVAMLELAIAGEPRFSISHAELERDGPSYTVETLETYADTDELFLIIGADAFADFERWRNPQRISSLARILVADRPGVPLSGSTRSAQRLDAPLLDTSSRDLRARAAAGRSLRYLVPDAVQAYLEAHGLYRAQQAKETTPRTS